MGYIFDGAERRKIAIQTTSFLNRCDAGNFIVINTSMYAWAVILYIDEEAMNQAAAQTVYNPNHLLNTLMKHLGLDTDGALARKLKLARNVIVDIRDGRIQVAASILLLMHEVTGISVDELRFLMGDRRAKYRLSYVIRSHPEQSYCPRDHVPRRIAGA